jgi:SAM-dependent methyltransferase
MRRTDDSAGIERGAQGASATRLFARYRGLDDVSWRKVLETPLNDGIGNRIRRLVGRPMFDRDLPGFPEPALQAAYVGSSGQKTLDEAFCFYRAIKSRCRELGRPVSPEWRILDFGCGWGRMIRFYLKDVPAENLCGLDVDESAIRICRQTMPGVRFAVGAPHPPAELRDESLDLIYAYSVFSHLAEEAHLAWVREFSRLLRPGGFVFATVQKRSFIEYCNAMTLEEASTVWHRSLARSFRPLEDTLARYDRGEFLYSPTGGGGVRDNSFYGEAVVPESYIDRCWPASLQKLVFDSSELPQALVVAQKRH